MRLARLARDWVFVVGVPVGAVFVLARQVAFGIFLVALCALGTFLMYRATEGAQKGIEATGKPTGKGSGMMLLWGQVLVLSNVLWLALFRDISALAFLLIATLPPGVMAIVAGVQLRRKSNAGISS